MFTWCERKLTDFNNEKRTKVEHRQLREEIDIGVAFKFLEIFSLPCRRWQGSEKSEDIFTGEKCDKIDY